MNPSDRILIEKAYYLYQQWERLEAQKYLKSASASAPAYTYSYTHKLDLGQGRTRFIHLSFSLNPETNQLELTGENVSDA